MGFGLTQRNVEDESQDVYSEAHQISKDSDKSYSPKITPRKSPEINDPGCDIWQRYIGPNDSISYTIKSHEKLNIGVILDTKQDSIEENHLQQLLTKQSNNLNTENTKNLLSSRDKLMKTYMKQDKNKTRFIKLKHIQKKCLTEIQNRDIHSNNQRSYENLKKSKLSFFENIY